MSTQSSSKDFQVPGWRGASGPLTAKNVETILEIEKAEKAKRTKSDIIAEAIARFCGSMVFVWVNFTWFGLWIVINTIPGIEHIDPFPFTFLTLVVSLEAIFLTTFILISQNLETKIAERRNHLDLQIDLLSEQENTKMIAMLEAISEKLGIDLGHDPHMEQLRQETHPQHLADQIDRREKKGVRD
jgi:uncharacterized membrane protein